MTHGCRYWYPLLFSFHSPTHNLNSYPPVHHLSLLHHRKQSSKFNMGNSVCVDCMGGTLRQIGKSGLTETELKNVLQGHGATIPRVVDVQRRLCHLCLQIHVNCFVRLGSILALLKLHTIITVCSSPRSPLNFSRQIIFHILPQDA